MGLVFKMLLGGLAGIIVAVIVMIAIYFSGTYTDGSKVIGIGMAGATGLFVLGGMIAFFVCDADPDPPNNKLSAYAEQAAYERREEQRAAKDREMMRLMANQGLSDDQ